MKKQDLRIIEEVSRNKEAILQIIKEMPHDATTEKLLNFLFENIESKA